MQLINYNGQIISADAAPPLVSNSVFRFAKGLFESILVVDRKIQLLAYHFERLHKGLIQSGYKIPPFFNEVFFRQELMKLIELSVYDNLRIRFQFGFFEHKLNYLAEAMPIDQDTFEYNKDGWTVGMIQVLLKEFTSDANLKNINIPLYSKGAAIAREHQWNDVLLSDRNLIIESGTANIFWIKKNVLHTPPLSSGCIEGVMRRHIIYSAWPLITTSEKELTTDELSQADEVFLTNAIRRIKWVKQIGNSIYTNQLSNILYHLLWEKL